MMHASNFDSFDASGGDAFIDSGFDARGLLAKTNVYLAYFMDGFYPDYIRRYRLKRINPDTGEILWTWDSGASIYSPPALWCLLFWSHAGPVMVHNTWRRFSPEDGSTIVEHNPIGLGENALGSLSKDAIFLTGVNNATFSGRSTLRRYDTEFNLIDTLSPTPWGDASHYSLYECPWGLLGRTADGQITRCHGPTDPYYDYIEPDFTISGQGTVNYSDVGIPSGGAYVSQLAGGGNKLTLSNLSFADSNNSIVPSSGGGNQPRYCGLPNQLVASAIANYFPKYIIINDCASFFDITFRRYAGVKGIIPIMYDTDDGYEDTLVERLGISPSFNTRVSGGFGSGSYVADIRRFADNELLLVLYLYPYDAQNDPAYARIVRLKLTTDPSTYPSITYATPFMDLPRLDYEVVWQAVMDDDIDGVVPQTRPKVISMLVDRPDVGVHYW